jgi:uncharacterized protein (DUF342 family)
VYQWDKKLDAVRQGPRTFTSKQAVERLKMLSNEGKVLKDEVKVLMGELIVLRNEVDRCKNEVKTADIKRKRAEKKIDRKNWKRVYNLRSRNNNYTNYR